MSQGLRAPSLSPPLGRGIKNPPKRQRDESETAVSQTRSSFSQPLGGMAAPLAPVRCAIYCRVSSREQAQGYSLEGQYHENRAYADRRKYRVVRRYQDVGSGRNLNRAGFERMMQDAAAGLFDVIVVWRRNRLNRDVGNAIAVDEYLQEHGVRVESIVSGPEEDTAEAELHRLMQYAFDQFEARSIAARCQLGREEAARLGIWPTRPPFGYVRNRESKRLELKPGEYEKVAWAIKQVAEGRNTRDVGHAIGRSHVCVGLWVRNPHYEGILDYAGIVRENAWPPVCDPAIIHKARGALDGKLAALGKATLAEDGSGGTLPPHASTNPNSSGTATA